MFLVFVLPFYALWFYCSGLCCFSICVIYTIDNVTSYVTYLIIILFKIMIISFSVCKISKPVLKMILVSAFKTGVWLVIFDLLSHIFKEAAVILIFTEFTNY